MRVRKVVLFSGAVLFSVAVFIINAATRNIDMGDSAVVYLRTAFNLLTFTLIFLLVQIYKREHPSAAVNSLSRLAVVAGIFLAAYVIVSLLPLRGFTSQDMKLFPQDYLTILFSSVISIIAGIFAITTVFYLKDLILYKRKKTTARNFWVMVGFFVAAAVSTVTARPLEETFLSGLLSGLAIVMIVVNSFRLAWIAYLPRKEKVYALLYSLLSFFGFLVVLIILSVSEGWTQKGIHYYSPPLFVFVQLASTFGVIYCGMAFISTLFHLPTAEAFDRKQTEITSLHNLSRLINQVFDLRDLAETATKMVTEVTQASAVWLEIIPAAGSDGQSGLLSVRNIAEEDIRPFMEPAGRSLRAAVLQSRTMLMVDDLHEDRRTHELPRLRTAGSILVIPLLSHDKVIGVLYATKDISYGFDKDDTDILTGFADQVAVAIENARLIERSLEKERLQRELMLAQEMQKRLIPQQLPEFSDVEMKAVTSPALEVGGDYYDVTMVDERRAALVVGDVSGKGVGAAFYMAEVKGIFQSLARIYPSPREFMVHANAALLSSIDRRSFISLIYSTLDTVTGEMVIARAGHCPFILVSGGKAEYHRPGGIGLGLKGGRVFAESVEEKKIVMKNGDVCVFYTDGVTESRSSAGEDFGYDRLLAVVEQNCARSAEQIREAIIHAVWDYTDAKGYHDDLTILVVKWTGNRRNKAGE